MCALLYRKQVGLLCGLILLLVASTSQARELPDFAALVKQNSPAVVNISTSQKKSVNSRFRHNFQIPDLPEDSPFNEFFERFFGEGHGRPDMPKEFDAQSLGSGFIISDDGYILTAAHVVESADEVVVHLSDRQEYVAEVIGSDKRSDVALLKIDAKNLPKIVEIGSTENLEVGEWVLAIGSPFGFGHSATAGIVSAKGRSLPSENYVPFIQTDVAINPGNSGGPLFDLDGKVVGINSQIYSRTGGFMGLSFAIPIEMAISVSEQLRTKGRVTRGWLGVMIQDVTRELADSFGMRHPTGALVARVLPDSPAEKGGLKAGDIILKYNGNKVSRSSMLPPMVGASSVDRPAKLKILRNGKKLELKISIGELPGEDELAQTSVKRDNSSRKMLGLELAELNTDLLQQLDMEKDTKGVLVEQVNPGPAQEAGIEQGDVIQMINNRKVGSIDEFTSELEKLTKGRNTPVLVLRQSGPIFLALRVPED